MKRKTTAKSTEYILPQRHRDHVTRESKRLQISKSEYIRRLLEEAIRRREEQEREVASA